MKIKYMVAVTLIIFSNVYAEENEFMEKYVPSTVSILSTISGFKDTIDDGNKIIKLTNQSIEALEDTKELIKYSLYWAKQAGNIQNIENADNLAYSLANQLKNAKESVNRLKASINSVKDFNSEVSNIQKSLSNINNHLIGSNTVVRNTIYMPHGKLAADTSKSISSTNTNLKNLNADDIKLKIDKISTKQMIKEFFTSEKNINSVDDLFGASKVSKVLNGAGNIVGIYNAFNKIDEDTEKYGTWTANSFFLVQSASEILNNVNPFAIVGIADAFTTCEDSDNVCQVKKAWLGTLGNPIGQLVNTSRKLCDSFEAASQIIENRYTTSNIASKLAKNILQAGAFSISQKIKKELFSSNSKEEFERNAELAAQNLEKNIDNYIRLLKSFKKENSQEIRLMKSKLDSIWSHFSIFRGFDEAELDALKTNDNGLYLSIGILERFRKEIRDKRGNISPKIMSQYVNAWVTKKCMEVGMLSADSREKASSFILGMAENINHLSNKLQEHIKRSSIKNKNENQQNLYKSLRKNQLLNLASKTQGQTSHIGAVDYYMANTSVPANYNDNNTNRQRETIQENPYYEAGTTILEAPVDVVLAWGDHPADLDSHMTGPLDATSGQRFHTWFSNRGNLEDKPNVMLYRDDTSHHSGGANLPEQTRINVTQPGKYNFYVHDYSNRGAEHSTAMSNSGAVVSLHSAGNRELPEGRNLGKKVVEYHIPTNKEGTVWHTFELDTKRNTIKEVNQFGNAKDSRSVPFNN